MPRVASYQPIYFAPDLDPSWENSPGVLTDLRNYVPTKRGTYANFANGPTQSLGAIADAPSWVLATYGTPVTGYVFKAVSGAAASARMFICSKGSKRRIIELSSAGTVTDRSKGATDYSASTVQWTMTNQGNAIIACNLYDATQVSTSGVFADLGGGSPKAQCCCANLGFVMLGNYDDGVNTYGDGWWCSALGNYASFTPSLATQAANGRLLDTPGPIRSLVPMRDSIIAYKDDSIYIGDYIGDTVNGVIWSWRVVSNNVGCASIHGVAVLNNTHYFLHRTGVYAYDGAQVSNVGGTVSKFINSKTPDGTGLTVGHSAVDENEGVIALGFANLTSDAQLYYILFLNVNTGRFGFGSSGTNWQESTATNGKLYAFMHCNVGDLQQWEPGSGQEFTGKSGLVCIGTNDGGTTGKLRIPAYNAAIVTAAVGQTYLQFGYVANSVAMTQISRLWMRLLSYGTQSAAPTCSLRHSRREGDQTSGLLSLATSAGGTWNSNNFCFDFSGEGTDDRALQPIPIFFGPHELGGIALDMQVTGRE
jgi:hypothetical protein